MTIPNNVSLEIAALRQRYLNGSLKVIEGVKCLLDRIATAPEHNIWITRLPEDKLLKRVQALADKDPASLPLYGIPFVVKDNFDVAGMPTTVACPEFAYEAIRTAPVVQKLLDAGAILFGKTNMDQFATGLSGTRSPHGECKNSFNPEYISGGSSSGSAVAVAMGLASFSLGTDTAGSGRVPAAFNNIVGIKPTRGLVSTQGVVPACRSLDCVSIFGLNVNDCMMILDQIKGYDAEDPFSRDELAPPTSFKRDAFRFGTPEEHQLKFFKNREYKRLFLQTKERLLKMGGVAIEIDYTLFNEAAELLYGGPWIAERYLALQAQLERDPDAIHPVIREIIAKGTVPTATEAFDAYHRLKGLKQKLRGYWQEMDILLTPTAGTHYRIEQMLGDPIQLNTNLGYYTNFFNLLDLCAFAVPSGFTNNELPFGITLTGPAFSEPELAMIADKFHRNSKTGAGVRRIPVSCHTPTPSNTNDEILLCVCGAHMENLPLNHQLTGRNATLVKRCKTAPLYQLYALENFDPPRPGMVRMEPGVSLNVEVWRMPAKHLGSFVAGVPAPLGIGTVELEDGQQVNGFICEHYAVQSARNISELGSWRVYLEEHVSMTK